MKKYWVGIYEGTSHGKYGKDFYTAWQLEGNNKNDVKELALELIATCTWREMLQTKFDNERVMKMFTPWNVKDIDERIGEYANKSFSVKVRVDN